MPDLSHRFLCSCFRLGDDKAWAESADWDWEQLFAEATEEALLPALYSRARELQVDTSLPPSILDFLSSVDLLNADRNDAILKEVKLAVRLLNEVHIEPVLLKGAAYLATGVYKRPAARYLADVDLLIPEGQITQAAQVLIANGFEIEDNDPFSHFRHHHPPLMRHGAVHLELHHTLTMSQADTLLTASDLIESSMSAELQGSSVRVPCPTHMMAHLILHSQLQHPYNERIWPPIKAMYDLLLLQRRFADRIDWSRISDAFRKAGHSRTLALHLLRVEESLGFPAPFPIPQTLTLRIAWQRRQILRHLPGLRYLDPIYMFSIIVGRRWRIVTRVLRTPDGLSYLLKEFGKPHIYTRFFEDVMKGRGH
jgi:hypothetical protein